MVKVLLHGVRLFCAAKHDLCGCCAKCPLSASALPLLQQEASAKLLEEQQNVAEDAAASVAAAAAARANAEGRCAQLQAALDGLNVQIRQLLEAQAGGQPLSEQSECTACTFSSGCLRWCFRYSYPGSFNVSCICT